MNKYNQSTRLTHTSSISHATIQDENGSKTLITSNKNRRQSIIPSSHLPRTNDLSPPMEEENEDSSSDDLLLIDIDNLNQTNNKIVSSCSPNGNYDVNMIPQMTESDINTGQGESKEEFDFDSFILGNFTQYSGKQDINTWLDETVRKFNRLVVSNYSRHKAIPLLVEGAANKIYVKNKRYLHSFADFQELLLLHFDNDDPIPIVHHRQSSVMRNSHQPTQSKSIDEKITPTMTTFINSHFSEKTPKHHSTALHDHKTVTFTDETFNSQTTTNPTPLSTTNNISNSNDTTNVLRKALIHQLMNNPKTFRGGRDDVIKWLEEIEHLFEIAQIPDNNKLNLISYTLRGDALLWYKNNKSSFTSWETFVSELKKTFVSIYYEELAFKKLEAYSQTEHQSICNFYNEVIKLCNEADPTMSDSTKLKHLLNKTKSTLQFEVRRKKPTTSKEFVEYAKEVEELFQLTSFNTNTRFDNYNNNPISPTKTISPDINLPTFNNPSHTYSSTTRPPKWNNFNPDATSRYSNNNYRSPSSVPYPNTSFRPQPTSSSLPNGQRSSHVQSNFSSTLNRPSINQNHNYDQNRRFNNPQRSRTSPRVNTPQHNINSLVHSNYTAPSVPVQQSLSNDYDTQHQPKDLLSQTNPNF